MLALHLLEISADYNVLTLFQLIGPSSGVDGFKSAGS
jgi:hypothetical protein